MSDGTLPGGDPLLAFVYGVPIIAAVGIALWGALAAWDRIVERWRRR
jgi:hypothetical protein